MLITPVDLFESIHIVYERICLTLERVFVKSKISFHFRKVYRRDTRVRTNLVQFCRRSFTFWVVKRATGDLFTGKKYISSPARGKSSRNHRESRQSIYRFSVPFLVSYFYQPQVLRVKRSKHPRRDSTNYPLENTNI